MPPRWTVLAAAPLVAIALVVAVGPAVAHGWSVGVDDQVVGDDTVVLEHVSLLEPATLAVHLVEDGDLGATVGVREFDEQGEYGDVSVPLDREAWTGVEGTARLAVAVHTTDGDATFEWPGEDGLFRPDDPVVERLTVEKTDGASGRVVAVRQSTAGNVTVASVDLPADGYVVLYQETDDGRGDVVGVRPLGAGHHEGVSVAVDHRFYNGERARLYLVAGVHRDDGDGTFEPAEDPAVAVNGSAVTTTFDAEKTTDALPTPSPTATVEPTPTPTATATATESAPTTAPPENSPTPTPVGSPGLGLLVALVALSAVAALLRRR